MEEKQQADKVLSRMSDSMRVSIADDTYLARVFMESGLARSAKSVPQAIVFIMAGREMALGPWESMNAFDIIEGRVAARANTRASMVKRSGRYNYVVKESTPKRCEIEWFERVGESQVSRGTSSFTIEEAQAAGLLGKDNWKKYPTDMLFARALSRGQRQYAPDVMGGTTYYDPDEQEEIRADILPGEIVEPAEVDKIAQKVASKLSKKPEPEPEVEEPAIDVEPVQVTESMPNCPWHGVDNDCIVQLSENRYGCSTNGGEFTYPDGVIAKEANDEQAGFPL